MRVVVEEEGGGDGRCVFSKLSSARGSMDAFSRGDRIDERAEAPSLARSNRTHHAHLVEFSNRHSSLHTGSHSPSASCRRTHQFPMTNKSIERRSECNQLPLARPNSPLPTESSETRLSQGREHAVARTANASHFPPKLRHGSDDHSWISLLSSRTSSPGLKAGSPMYGQPSQRKASPRAQFPQLPTLPWTVKSTSARSFVSSFMVLSALSAASRLALSSASICCASPQVQSLHARLRFPTFGRHSGAVMLLAGGLLPSLAGLNTHGALLVAFYLAQSRDRPRR